MLVIVRVHAINYAFQKRKSLSPDEKNLSKTYKGITLTLELQESTEFIIIHIFFVGQREDRVNRDRPPLLPWGGCRSREGSSHWNPHYTTPHSKSESTQAQRIK